jgi:hypothetical protein
MEFDISKWPPILDEAQLLAIDDMVQEKQAQDMQAQVHRKFRHRINVSTSTKGVKTWDVTCEAEGMTMEEVLTESDKLVKEMEDRYQTNNPS